MRQFIERQNPHLLIALALTIAYHGALLVSGSFKRTYDAFVHIFFADHYARAWFDHWEYRWYTGFTMTSYPPGSQQSIALLSPVTGLLGGHVVVQLLALLLLMIGIYRFSKIWVSEEAAGYAALLTVFASSINETVHVFGQLPTTFSLAFLLNALPYAYQWLESGKWRYLFIAWSVNAATTAGHHVTTLFGAVFFMGPIFVLAIVEKFRTALPDEPGAHPSVVTRRNLKPLMMRRVRRIVPVVSRSAVYGVGLIIILVLVVLPYWLWSRADPITQVSIPHASRDSYIENTAAGLVFWLVPYGLALVLLPYAFYKGYATKAWPMAMSITLLFVLGTGGTTPIPRMLLGGAFDILTLDRFTFWATILILPLLGEFVVSLRHGRVARYLREQFGDLTWRTVQIGLVVAYLLVAVGVANLTHFRRFQPQEIDTTPIVNFLSKDQHDRWRYLTLGFGDQVAWLGAQTTATSVDGNYHSARRLPELTTTPVERLEGSKFSGIPGLGSLQQFLAVPDKYNLKFVFSNDQFYDPLLYFSGWHRVQRLENGIMVWERSDIPPLPAVLPRKEIPVYQRIMWGTVPMGAIALSFVMMSSELWAPPLVAALGIRRWRIWALWRWVTRPFSNRWRRIDDRLRRWSVLPDEDDSPQVRWQIWYDWVASRPWPRPAAPSARFVRIVGLLVVMIVIIAGCGVYLLREAQAPEQVVIAYYDDLDFRRFNDAYERLDPETRPSLEQYLLELSVEGGLLASYAKLDNVRPRIVEREADRIEMAVETDWVTALAAYPSVQEHVLVRRDGQWYIEPGEVDVTIPPDQLFRRGEVGWYAAGRRRVTTETTSFGDVLDRPEIQILSARLVEVDGRYSVVGELINTDADPADLTVTAYLYDENGEELTWYNAQAGMMHKVFPKEVTPFRVDFEGVAGAAIGDDATADEATTATFDPHAYSPIQLAQPVDSFEVYAKAVVTTHDLFRDLAVQDLRVTDDGTAPRLEGELYNVGTLEATIPHIFVTYYDENNQVVWVDDYYTEYGVRPQRSRAFSIPITRPDEVITILNQGDVYANILQEDVSQDADWMARIPLPPSTGYHSASVSVHYFVGALK